MLSMPFYMTWAVTLKREPLPLPHSLSSLLLRNVVVWFLTHDMKLLK